IRIGPSRKQDSSSQGVPVISPLPLSENHPPNAGSSDCLPRGQIAVTPVRTYSPSMSVVCPTSTPAMSVMAFSGPGVPSKGTPRSRARGLADCCAKASGAKAIMRKQRLKFVRRDAMNGGLQEVAFFNDCSLVEQECQAIKRKRPDRLRIAKLRQ